MKHLYLPATLVLLGSPVFGSMSTWPDPYGRSLTPSSTWNSSSSQGVFAGLAPRSSDTSDTPAQGDPAPAPGPVMSLSITANGLLDFVFQQLYSSFSGEEAERIRAVLAPQYAAMANHLQGAFGGAEMVSYPDPAAAPSPDPSQPSGSTGDPTAGSTGSTNAPAVAAKVSTFSAPAVAGATEPLSVTQSMAVVAATSLLAAPQPTLSGPSTNSLLLTGGAGLGGTTPLSTSVPEPSTMILVGAGLALVLSRRRR